MPSMTPVRNAAIFSKALPTTLSSVPGSATEEQCLDRLVEVARRHRRGTPVGSGSGQVEPVRCVDEDHRLHPPAGEAVVDERSSFAGEIGAALPPAPPRSTRNRAGSRPRSRRATGRDPGPPVRSRRLRPWTHTAPCHGRGLRAGRCTARRPTSSRRRVRVGPSPGACRRAADPSRGSGRSAGIRTDRPWRSRRGRCRRCSGRRSS